MKFEEVDPQKLVDFSKTHAEQLAARIEQVRGWFYHAVQTDDFDLAATYFHQMVEMRLQLTEALSSFVTGTNYVEDLKELEKDAKDLPQA
jgi:hypothetical protein